MDKRIASVSFNDDPLTRHLIDLLNEIEVELGLLDAIFYYNYPLFRDESNRLYRSKALLASRSHGVVVLCPLANPRDGNFSKLIQGDRELSQLDSIIYGKLLRSKVLRRGRRDVALNINTALFVPNGSGNVQFPTDLESEVARSKQELTRMIENNRSAELAENQWGELVSLLEGGKAISRVDTRDVTELPPDSKASILKRLEDRITNFDRDQRRAAISVVKGPQRIRGIAGSGKTIVLAMKAVHIHLDDPDALILCTFWTKSLYDLMRQLITRFFRQFKDTDPDWDKLHVRHAWGGRNTEGVYYNTCLDNHRRPLALRDVRQSGNKTKFDAVCTDLLKARPLSQRYDYVFIDEGQDLPPSFYQLCFEICKGGAIDRNVVWAYDELQTIMDTRPQDVRRTFGTLSDGRPRMDLERAQRELSRELLPHDIVLRRSYRNPPEVLVCAHALGMGIYGHQIVQTLENVDHWADLGYVVEEGQCVAGQRTVVRRPEENSPLNLAEFVGQEDIVKYAAASDFFKEVKWVCQDIFAFLNEGLRPEDVLIISLDDRNARTYFSEIAKELQREGVGTNNLQDAGFTVPKFFIEDHVSMATVYKAKGNEAAVVYVIGVDAISPYANDVRARNRLFTAFTRSRAWLRVSGMTPAAEPILNELSTALRNFPRMEFQYPDPKMIPTIQRDLSQRSAKLQQIQQMLLDLEYSDLSEEELLDLVRSTKAKK